VQETSQMTAKIIRPSSLVELRRAEQTGLLPDRGSRILVEIRRRRLRMSSKATRSRFTNSGKERKDLLK
jgi:hypothetical protein